MIGSMFRRGAFAETGGTPSAPVLTASSIKSASLTLSWTATGTTYEVDYSTDGVTWTPVANYTTNTATTVVAGSLVENYGYDFRVRASNDGGVTWSSYGTTSALTLGAVSALTLPSTTSSSITVNWTDNSTQETGFRIERSTDNTNWTLVTTTAADATSATVSGLSASTLYYIRVRANAYDGTNNSAWVSSSATTASATPTAAWTLDFSSGTPSGYTLTRASSGTYVDSSGYIASASTDVARLTHDSSGNRLGLLVEESRTNLVLQSEDFATTWVAGRMTVTTNSVTAPDNTTTADTITDTTVINTHGMYQTVSVTSGNSYTISCYIKKGTVRYVCLGLWDTTNSNSGAEFDLDNITAKAVWGTGYSASSNATIASAGNGWYRCSVTVVAKANTDYPSITHRSTASTSGSGGSIVESYAGSTSNYSYAWGFQCEAGASATSYVKTTSASVARSADLAHVLDSSITSWGDPGALVIHFYPPGKAGTILSTDDASTAQVGIEASSTTAARAFWSSGSTATGTIGTGVQKAVHYWNGSTSKFCINGGTVQSGTNNFTIANADFVTLGAEATDSSGVPGTFSQYANCIIRKVEFYSGTLTDANLQTITT